MQIDVSFDQAVGSLPAGFVAAVDYAVNYLDSLFTNNVTITIDVGYGEIAGQALGANDLGESEANNFVNESYSSVRSSLLAEKAPGASSLPATSPLSGSLYMSQAEAKALGLYANNGSLDGYVGFSSALPWSYSATATPTSNQYYFIGVVEHEITEDMGRVSFINDQPSDYSPIDLFRYSSSGVRDLTTGGAGSTAYFSINNGATNLGTWNNQTSNGDLADWYPSGPAPGGNDAFNDYANSGVIDTISSSDITLMEALGWTTAPSNGISLVATSSEALQGGAAVTLLSGAPTITDSASTTLSSATIEIANGGGASVAGDELYVNGIQNGSVGNGVTASWNATTSTLTLTGSATLAVYDTLLSEVTYKDTGADSSSGSHPQRTVTWSVNDGTNSFDTTSQVTIDRAPAASNDVASDVAGSTITTTAAAGVLSVDTDLDGDPLSVTGVSDTAHGAGSVGASLAGAYGHLTLNANGSYSYVADIASAIAGAPTGSTPVDSFTYTVSDGKGGVATAALNISVDRPPVVTVANVTLSAGQTSVAASSLFTASDPDGNAIATYGFMDTGGGHFVLNGVAQANNNEIDVTAAQLSQLTYQLTPGAADTLEVRVNDGTMWSNWASFIATAPLVIQTDGSTSLTEVGSNYFLDGSGGSGPELKYQSADVVAGASEFGGFLPIGAVQTASGYDVAWEIPGANEYTVWATDSNGNYLSNLFGVVSGTSTALESIETTFGQDLNRDGVIGIPPPVTKVIQTDGSTSLTEVGSNYFLDGSGGSGPELKYQSADVVAGASEFGGFLPIGAVQTASGYDVAWEIPGANEYTVWATDSNGNYLSNLFGVVSGTSTALESIETAFGQDLNRDGVIGIPPPVTKVIQTDGSTSLTEVGSNYFLDGSGGSGPELKYQSADVVAGASEFGGFLPIGAVQTASGYDVAWEIPGANEYTVWATDSNGNYLSNLFGVVSGTSTALESIETTFGQDLNRDGVIGIPPPVTKVIQTDGSTSLTEVGSNYFLDGSGGSGPELKYQSADVVAGASEFGGFLPIGAVQTASGYDVAWEIPGANEYTVWATDSNGNYLSNLFGVVSGTSTALESIETTFGQDLNRDGVIGIPTTSKLSVIAHPFSA